MERRGGAREEEGRPLEEEGTVAPLLGSRHLHRDVVALHAVDRLLRVVHVELLFGDDQDCEKEGVSLCSSTATRERSRVRCTHSTRQPCRPRQGW